MNQLKLTNASQRSVIALFVILMLSSPAVYAGPEVVVHECECEVFLDVEANAEIRSIVNKNASSWSSGDIVVLINGQDWAAYIFRPGSPWVKIAGMQGTDGYSGQAGETTQSSNIPPPTFGTCYAEWLGCSGSNRPSWLVNAYSADAPIDSMEWEVSRSGAPWDLVYPSTECNVYTGRHSYQWVGTNRFQETVRGLIKTWYGPSDTYCTISMFHDCNTPRSEMPNAVDPGDDLLSAGSLPSDFLKSPSNALLPTQEPMEVGTIIYGTLTSDGVPPEGLGRSGVGPKSTGSPLLDTLREIKNGT